MHLKRCFKCGRLLPLSEFYKTRAMKDGRLNKCKDCTKKDVKHYREENLEKIREYDRNRPNKTERYTRAKSYIKTLKGKQAKAKANRKYSTQYREKRIAHNEVSKALANKKLTPLPCEICGSTERIQAHHFDYSKPLEIIWLCEKHHKQRHKFLNEMKRKSLYLLP